MTEYKVVVTEEDTRWFNLEGELHREDGPAIEYKDGSKYYYIKGKRHREDGPAIVYENGDKVYYMNDKLHREDGPAMEYADGDKVYYIDGIEFTKKEFKNRNKTCEGRVVEIDGVKYKLAQI